MADEKLNMSPEKKPPTKRARLRRKKRLTRRKSPRAGGAASPRKKKRGPAKREGRGPARATHPRLTRLGPGKPPSPPQDKKPQSKGAKAAMVKGREEAPAALQPAPEPPPQSRDATRAEKAEKEEKHLCSLSFWPWLWLPL